MSNIKVDNAIILAAGYSSRFVPLCFDTPKGLLKIKGETLIERQIRQLKEIGINEIHVVTGAYAEQFEFLKEKCSVNLIFNKDYATKNNFASIYVARDVLKNSLITSSDLYFPENIFQNTAEHSYYASVYIKGATNQRSLTLDENDKIIKTTYGGENTWITFGGQAFFTENLSKKLIEFINPVFDNPEYKNKYWVDFQDEHLEELPMYIKRLKQGSIVEFNTLQALQDFDKDFNSREHSKTMDFICSSLDANERDLSEFVPIKSYNAAVGCIFKYQNNVYEYFNQEQIIREQEFN